MAAFALIIGLVGVYFSSAFVRLEVFGSISIIILASIGIINFNIKNPKSTAKTYSCGN